MSEKIAKISSHAHVLVSKLAKEYGISQKMVLDIAIDRLDKDAEAGKIEVTLQRVVNESRATYGKQEGSKHGKG